MVICVGFSTGRQTLSICASTWRKPFWHLERMSYSYLLFFSRRSFPPFIGLFSLLLLRGFSLNVVAVYSSSHVWIWLMIDPQNWTIGWILNICSPTCGFKMDPSFEPFPHVSIHILHPFLKETEAVLLPYGGGTKTKQYPTQILYWVAASNRIFQKCEQSQNKNYNGLFERKGSLNSMSKGSLLLLWCWCCSCAPWFLETESPRFSE